MDTAKSPGSEHCHSWKEDGTCSNPKCKRLRSIPLDVDMCPNPRKDHLNISDVFNAIFRALGEAPPKEDE